MKHVKAGVLDIAYCEAGPADGPQVLLLHGFPYDIHSFDAVSDLLAADGYRVIVPFLRGYGPTRFLSQQTPRSGEQAVLGTDLLALMDALELPMAILGGYDWGGRAACVVAALWPHRVRGLVSCIGYNIQNIAAAMVPSSPEEERRLWYQYYFHSERGRAGLEADRSGICRLLWQLWSPSWRFDDAVFAQTAASFDNPDFVEVVIHSYRHRFGLAAGDPEAAEVDRALAAQPPITVPTIVMHGEDDGVTAAGSSVNANRHFTGAYERRVVPGTGHNVPQEAPAAFAAAIRDLA